MNRLEIQTPCEDIKVRQRLKAYIEAVQTEFEGFLFDIDGTIRDEKGVDKRIISLISELGSFGFPTGFVTNGTELQSMDVIETLFEVKNPEKVMLYTENGLLGARLIDIIEGRKSRAIIDLMAETNAFFRVAPGLLEATFKKFLISRNSSIEFQLTSFIEYVRNKLKDLEIPVSLVDSMQSITLMPEGKSKADAVNHFAQLNAIKNKSHIFRIGDQGQKGGNDYEFLSGSGSFSSGDTVKHSLTPLMVFGKSGEPLKGTVATRAALSDILTNMR